MAIIQIATDVANNGDASMTATFSVEPSVGSVIMLFALTRNGGTFSFPASFNSDFNYAPSNRRFEAASKAYAGEGSGFTVTRSDSTSDAYLVAAERAASSAFDQSDTSSGSGTETLALGPITPTHDDTALFTGIMWSNNTTGAAVDNSFTQDGIGDPRGDTASKEIATSSAQDVDWTWTNSVNSEGVLFCYGVPAAGTTRRSSLTTLGCS
jgi:hypothetical protein